MKKFEFSTQHKHLFVPFSGRVFYNRYKNSDFLRHSDNIESILFKAHELRQMLKKVNPGEIVLLKGMYLEKDIPLVIKRTGTNIKVENSEFTSNRLTGLVAAYVFENRQIFPNMKSSEALALGLTWDNKSESKCRLYLSAVTGTEHFFDQFYYWPLICALYKLQAGKITEDPVVKIARVKNPQGDTMAKILMRNLTTAERLWKFFSGDSHIDLELTLNSAPQKLKAVLFDK